MGRNRKTVRDLAKEAGLDVDEALLTLWDGGIEHVSGPADSLVSGDLNRARRLLGVATRREIRDPAYWRGLLGLSAEELRDLLKTFGAQMSVAAKRLPPKAVTRLKAHARARHLDPISGRRSEQRQAAQPSQVQDATEPFEWKTPGHERPLRWLSEEEVLAVHHALVEDFAITDDPLEPPGVRSEALLASAVFRPQTSIGGILKYPTVEASAAALLHAIVLDHPFYNGNKRTALVAMLVFLDENGLMPTCVEDDLFKLVLQVAQHRIPGVVASDNRADREVLAIAEWLCGNTRSVELGEYPLPFRKLRRILVSFGCELSFPGGVGNRINIQRDIEERRGILKLRRRRTLFSQIYYGDEGREVQKNTLKKLREELHLDDSHGIDSLAFYGAVDTEPSEFIVRYRKTLRRLARL